MRRFLTATDKVTCFECGQLFNCITITHLHKHKMTIKEYKEKHKITGGNIRSLTWKLKHQALGKKRFKEGKLKLVTPTEASLAKAREKLKTIDMAKIHSITDKAYWARIKPDDRKKEMKDRWKRIYERNPELKKEQIERIRQVGYANRKFKHGTKYWHKYFDPPPSDTA